MQFAVIGDPVAHSISPALHTAVFERLGTFARYEKIHVLQEELESFAASLKAEKTADGAEVIRGVNVTIPHKVAILPLLDEIRGDASSAGAVNTVVREDGAGSDGVREPRTTAKLIGYNTDMEGLLRALEGAGAGYRGKVVCIFGAGGAALGAAVKAAAEGAKTVRVIARNMQKAKEVVLRAVDAAGPEAFFPEITEQELSTSTEIESMAADGNIPANAVSDADVLINATPLGMQGYAQDFEDFRFLDALPKTALVYDCVYIPAETTLLREARARGLKAENGLSMLVWQGLLSDVYFLRAAGEERFTKAEILSQEMFAAVYQTLENVLG